VAVLAVPGQAVVFTVDALPSARVSVTLLLPPPAPAIALNSHVPFHLLGGVAQGRKDRILQVHAMILQVNGGLNSAFGAHHRSFSLTFYAIIEVANYCNVVESVGSWHPCIIQLFGYCC
jgi:hypothetical protein